MFLIHFARHANDPRCYQYLNQWILNYNFTGPFNHFFNFHFIRFFINFGLKRYFAYFYLNYHFFKNFLNYYLFQLSLIMNYYQDYQLKISFRWKTHFLINFRFILKLNFNGYFIDYPLLNIHFFHLNFSFILSFNFIINIPSIHFIPYFHFTPNFHFIPNFLFFPNFNFFPDFNFFPNFHLFPNFYFYLDFHFIDLNFRFVSPNFLNFH